MKTPSNYTSTHKCQRPASRYRETRFLKSCDILSQLPLDSSREVAFAGRSNSGKSSAINLLTGQKYLARISKTPGRTQLLNFFLVEQDCYLVDLPGYGFARVPDEMRFHWQGLLQQYLMKSKALRGVMLLMDIRHPLTNMDKRFLECLASRDMQAHVLLTKSDKLSRTKAIAILRQLQETLLADFSGVSSQLFSALTGNGVNEAHAQLDRWLLRG